MVILTGARGYVKYDFEASYGSAVSGNSNKRFGLQERVSSWTLNNNRIVMPTLNQTEPEKFAYGQETGALSIGFVLSNPWIFGGLYGVPTATGSSNDYTHTWQKSANKTKDVRSFTTEIGLQQPSANLARTLKGCILRNFSISTNVGAIVECTTDIGYSNEDAPSTTFVSPVAGASDPTFPYTFAHATLKLNNAIVAKIQSADIAWNQNPDMLWGLGSHQAVDAYRRVFEITGTFSASWVDKTLLDHILAQVQIPNAASYEEVVGDKGSSSDPEIELKFTNGLATTAEKSITITLTGVSPTEHSVSGLEPVEPVFEQIQWQAKSAIITAGNSESSEM